MPTIIDKPTLIEPAGNQSKVIEEYIGLVNSGTEELSIARMQIPPGWEEPGQRPEFDEYSIVLNGVLLVTTPTETIEVKAGQAIITHSGKWVRYSTPADQGAEYISVCLPAFCNETINRDHD